MLTTANSEATRAARSAGAPSGDAPFCMLDRDPTSRSSASSTRPSTRARYPFTYPDHASSGSPSSCLARDSAGTRPDTSRASIRPSSRQRRDGPAGVRPNASLSSVTPRWDQPAARSSQPYLSASAARSGSGATEAAAWCSRAALPVSALDAAKCSCRRSSWTERLINGRADQQFPESHFVTARPRDFAQKAQFDAFLERLSEILFR